jgi:glutaconate CoA-transferase, subunit B
MANFDIVELMIVAASKVLEDKKSVFVGTGLPLAAAALAKKTHAPNLLLVFEAGGLGPELPRIPISVGESITFHRGIEAGGMDNVMGAAARGLIDYGFLGGAQIDQYGNLNTTVIGDYAHPRARLPGSGGANDIGSLCWKTIIIMRHDRQRFVEKVDFLTTPGYLSGPMARERAGLARNTGPYRVVTTLGVLGFDDASKRMKLLAVYPGVSIGQVVENTGFELLVADTLQELMPPTDEELRILREEVDPVGLISAKRK